MFRRIRRLLMLVFLIGVGVLLWQGPSNGAAVSDAYGAVLRY